MEQALKSHLLNKEIVDMEFFNLNDSYLIINPASQWVFDGGVQIKFTDSVFSIGWEYESEGFDFSMENTIDVFLGDEEYFPVAAKQIPGISRLIGSKITDAKIKWDYYQNMDEEGEIIPEKIFIPVELLLTFETHDTLQLALVSYQIKENPFGLTELQYNQSGELLISLNEVLTIKETSHQ